VMSTFLLGGGAPRVKRERAAEDWYLLPRDGAPVRSRRGVLDASDAGVPWMVARLAWSESAPRTGTCCHGMERPCAVARGVLGAGRAGMNAPSFSPHNAGRLRAVCRHRSSRWQSETWASGSLQPRELTALRQKASNKNYTE